MGAANISDGALQVVLPLLALQHTDSPLEVALVTAALQLPWLLLGLPAGVWVDELSRRGILATAATLRVVVIGVLAWTSTAAGGLQTWHLVAAALGLGVAEVLFDITKQAVVPSLVGRTQLVARNGEVQVVEVVGNQFAGPALGGFVAGISLFWALSVPGLLYGVSLLVLVVFLLPHLERPASASWSLALDYSLGIREGVAALRRRPSVAAITLVDGASQLLFGAWLGVAPVHFVGENGLGWSEGEYGLLFLLGGVGGAVGAASTQRVRSVVGPTSIFVVGLMGWSIFLGIPGLTDSWLVIGPLIVVGAAAGTMFGVAGAALRQDAVPDHLLGRVVSLHRVLTWGAVPIGVVVGGLCAELSGTRAVMLGAAGLTLLLIGPVRRVVIDPVSDA